MPAAADLVLTDGVVHPLTGENEAEAVAIRGSDIVAVGRAYDVELLADVETTVVDLDGAHLLPGFVDAHTHLEMVGRREQEADLTGAESPDACLDRLRAIRDERPDSEWILGFGYDESTWGGEYLTREELDAVSDERPVAAVREDMHLASLNGVALERHREAMPDRDVRIVDGEPTGVVVEKALEVIWAAIRPDADRLREYLLAAQDVANRRGITAVHDMVRRSEAPKVYRTLDAEGKLTLRVRLNYWADHLDAVLETGLRTNHGSDRVRMGAIKTYVDGSIGGRTARLSTPYADTPDTDADADDAGEDRRGEWVVDPEALATLVDRVDDAGLQFAAHAIGDEAIAVALDALEGTGGERHRIEHAEVLTDELIDRLAASDVVVSAQPNFLKWAREGGLYDRRLGENRRRESNRFRSLREAGATLAFGSDCMPLDPLFGIEQVVTAPGPEQRLPVTDALRAYTSGGAYAAFQEGRQGTIEPGTCGDLVVLSDSPWESDAISEIPVEFTIVGGDVVYDGR